MIWLSEDDAKKAGIVDNDWVELFNTNGAIAARAVVSQRVNPGMVHDVPRSGKDHQHPGLGDHRHPRRYPQLGAPGSCSSPPT